MCPREHDFTNNGCNAYALQKSYYFVEIPMGNTYRANSTGIVLLHVSTEHFITGVSPGPEAGLSLVRLRIARFLSEVIETE